LSEDLVSQRGLWDGMQEVDLLYVRTARGELAPESMLRQVGEEPVVAEHSRLIQAQAHRLRSRAPRDAVEPHLQRTGRRMARKQPPSVTIIAEQDRRYNGTDSDAGKHMV